LNDLGLNLYDLSIMRTALMGCALLLLLVANSFAQHQSPPTSSQSSKCSESQAKEAEEHASTLDSWAEVHEAFKKFGVCDDGAVWEGYSDNVMRPLIRDWRHFSTMNEFIRADAPFRSSILRHIDDLSSKEHLLTVQHNAQSNCPEGAANLCRSIDKRVSVVLERS
jgi:hypothetical protein